MELEELAEEMVEQRGEPADEASADGVPAWVDAYEH